MEESQKSSTASFEIPDQGSQILQDKLIDDKKSEEAGEFEKEKDKEEDLSKHSRKKSK